MTFFSENVLQGLEKSFIMEPMQLCEVKKGKYLINMNGRHRFAILKAHYLNELDNCKNDEEIDDLKLKYTIPVKIEELDIIKTYSQYLLRFIEPESVLKEEIKNDHRTGRSCIEDYENNVKSYNDSELLQYIKNSIEKVPKDELMNRIPEIYIKEEYFREFIDNNFKGTIIEKLVIEWCEKNSKDIDKRIIDREVKK